MAVLKPVRRLSSGLAGVAITAIVASAFGYGLGSTAVTTAAVPDHLAQAGERIIIPAGVSVTIVGGAPTAGPSSTPAATPTAAPSPTPTASAGQPAFGSRPASGPIVKDGGTNVTISNVTIDGGTRDAPKGIGITIRNVTGTITIRDVDLSDLVGGIYISQSTGTLLIENLRSRNIGDGTIGSGHSNHIQLAESSFKGAIRGSSFLGGRTEDMVSTWHSGGLGSGQELVIEGNRFQGLVSDTATARAWTSSSGTGVILSDGKGSARNGHIIVRNNTFLTPGQVGIQHIDGPGLQVYSNVIYGEQRSKSNNPMTTWEGTPVGENHHNRYCWRNPSGVLIEPWFDGGINPQINDHDNVRDWTPNTTNAASAVCNLDPATLRVAFP